MTEFSKAQLKKFGWVEGKGLGKNEDGIARAIKPKLKFDTAGIGHDLSKQFTHHWWEKMFNKTASNITVEKTQDGVSVKRKNSDGIDDVKCKKAKSSLYSSFVTSGFVQSETCSDPSSDANSDNEDSRSNTSESLYDGLGDVTAHKAARLGIKMNEMRADMEEQEVEPSEVFVDLGMLIVEGRVPGLTERGYGEGPHCPPSQHGQLIRHQCDLTLPQCQRQENFNKHMLLLYKNNIPMSVEVLLCPDCCYGNHGSQRVTGATAAVPEPSYVLLEQWTLQMIPKRVPETQLSARGLIQAVRSFLHFSQLSAWYSLSKGKNPQNVMYRICVPGEAFSNKFNQTPVEHTFPLANIGKQNGMKISVRSLPRSDVIPKVYCHEHSAQLYSINTKKMPPGLPCTLNDKLQSMSLSKSGAAKGSSKTKKPRETVAQRMLAFHSNQSGKSCRSSDEVDKDNPMLGDSLLDPPQSLQMYHKRYQSPSRSGSPSLEAPEHLLSCSQKGVARRYEKMKSNFNDYGQSSLCKDCGQQINRSRPRSKNDPGKEDYSEHECMVCYHSHRMQFDHTTVDLCGQSNPTSLHSKNSQHEPQDDPRESKKLKTSFESRQQQNILNAKSYALPYEKTYKLQSSENADKWNRRKENFYGLCQYNERMQVSDRQVYNRPISKLVTCSQQSRNRLSGSNNETPNVEDKSYRSSCSRQMQGYETTCDVSRTTADQTRENDKESAEKVMQTNDGNCRFDKKNASVQTDPVFCDGQYDEQSVLNSSSLPHSKTWSNGLCHLPSNVICEGNPQFVKQVLRPNHYRIDSYPEQQQSNSVSHHHHQSSNQCNNHLDKNGHYIPSENQKAKFRRSLDSATSMVFHNRTSLPLTSSPAPMRRGNCFDFDSSLTSVYAIKRALFDKENNDNEEQKVKCHILSTSAPALTTTNSLLGNFEESVLNGRLEPVSTVEGFTAEIGASGSFCPSHITVPVTVFFYTLQDNDKVTSPYLGHINLGKKGYHVPKKGTIQVTLFNPHHTVVKMFVVMYDLSDMPSNCQTFLRQRTLYMPSGANEDDEENQRWLRYLIHLRFCRSKSGKVYLHTDIRMVIFRKSDMDAATIHENNNTIAFELRSFTKGPTNPKFSPIK